eukprot:363885-Chlamydomonas_euryale.AAC.16
MEHGPLGPAGNGLTSCPGRGSPTETEQESSLHDICPACTVCASNRAQSRWSGQIVGRQTCPREPAKQGKGGSADDRGVVRTAPRPPFLPTPTSLHARL